MANGRVGGPSLPNRDSIAEKMCNDSVSGACITKRLMAKGI